MVDSTDALGDSFVVAWPASERVLDEEDEGFENLSSSIITPSSSLLAAAMGSEEDKLEDSLLDALAKLEDERARNHRLQRQVEVAQALAALPGASDAPQHAATRLGSAWRAHAARRAEASVRHATESRAAVRIQTIGRSMNRRRRTVAAAAETAAEALQRGLRAHVAALALRSKTHLLREIVRLREEVCRRERQVDACAGQIERSLEVSASHKAAAVAAANHQVAIEAALAKSESRVAELCRALEGAAESHERTQRNSCDRTVPMGSPVGSESAGDARPSPLSSAGDEMDDKASLMRRIVDLEGFGERLRLENANLLSQLAEQNTDLLSELAEQTARVRTLEEQSTQMAIDKEHAEELASRLLAEKLANADGAWPAPPTAPPGCMWGVGEEDDDLGDLHPRAEATTSARMSAPTATSLQRSF